MTLARLIRESSTFPGRLAVSDELWVLSFWRAAGVTSNVDLPRWLTLGASKAYQATFTQAGINGLANWYKEYMLHWSIGEYYSISPLKAQVSKDKYLASKSCNEPEVIDSDCFHSYNIGVPNHVGSRLFMFFPNSCTLVWHLNQSVVLHSQRNSIVSASGPETTLHLAFIWTPRQGYCTEGLFPCGRHLLMADG